VVLLGEVTGAQWKQYESFRPEVDGSVLKLPIPPVRSLNMMILCETANQAAAVKQIEAAVNQPWSVSF
jgi:hypothetical protein